MDGTTFDNLIKGLSRTRLSRLRVLQGLAAGAVAALTGERLAPEETEAHRRKRTICHCGDNNPQQIGCVTKRLSKKKARRHLRQHPYDYKGKCVKTPKPPPPPECGGACKPGEICCSPGSKKAGTCKPNLNACNEEDCLALAAACTADVQCCSGICNAGGSTTGPLADTANECSTCRSGGATCTTPGTQGTCCQGRTCIENGATDVCCSLATETCVLTAA